MHEGFMQSHKIATKLMVFVGTSVGICVGCSRTILRSTNKCSPIQPFRKAKPAASPHKLSDGGGMYLLLKPDGGRYWRMNYRYDGKQKTLSLGVSPALISEALREAYPCKSAQNAPAPKG